MYQRFALMLAAAATSGLIAGSAVAEEPKVPSSMTWTAYGTSSSGYAQSVAIGNALKAKHGTSMRVIPGKNDVSRMAPLRDGKAGYCACGIASFFGFEGVMLFAAKEWGPQPIRLLMTAIGSNNLALAVAADAGVKEYSDLKGKRVAWVRAGDALNVNAQAHLAFGGLTWDDVEKVEFPGYPQSWDGMLNGQVDAAFGSTLTPPAKRLEASPRGIYWPPVPHDDEEDWKRLREVGPHFVKNVGTSGAGLSQENPHIGASYPYPILVTNEDTRSDEVYALVRAMVESYDGYKDGAPGAVGWALDRQKFDWVIPYHEGAVRYFKEAGVWSDEFQAHNDRLLKRAEVITDAWEAFSDKGASDDENFAKEWLSARQAALESAGFNPVFK